MFMLSYGRRVLSLVLVLLLLPLVQPSMAADAAVAASDAAQITTAAATATAAAIPDTYIIGPGDTLQIFVWRNPELSTTLPVRPDGKISTPLIEDIVAVGKTPTQLARDMEKVLSVFVRSPQVNVIVTNALSAFNQVKVLGQVVRPSSIAFREGLTVMDAVLSVGGMTAFASGNRTRIMRKETSGKDRIIKVKLGDLMTKGRASDNPKLRAGDIVVVPEAVF
jgi:polysaccharide export outer membrane protein